MTPLAEDRADEDAAWVMLAEFALPSEPGNERHAMEQVCRIVEPLKLSPGVTDRLKTVVAEAALNAIEHGNRFRAELPVEIDVAISERALRIRVTDQGAGGGLPVAEEPDLNAKLVGAQSPRGWGLFLIKNMVDAMHIRESQNRHTIELVLSLERSSKGETDADGA